MKTIKEIDDELSKYPNDWKVSFGPLRLMWDGVHSYRGIYAEPACGYTSNGVYHTVADVRADLKYLTTESFGGWKGGDFYYNENQVLHVANAGDTSDAFIGEIVSPYDGYVDLIIVHVKEDF